MKAVHITLENFRNIAAAEIDFAPGVNVLWGDNAQGKSNILESVYYFARGKSFRGVPDKLLVRTGFDFAHAALSLRGAGDAYDTELSVTIPQSGRRRITRGGAPLSSVRELLGEFRAVLFCPEHLALVSGAPAERRSFLDIALAQLYPAYVSALTEYTRVLAQRGARLKQAAEGAAVSRDEWDVYARQLSCRGAEIARFRLSYTARLDAHMKACFADMTGGREVPALTYTGQQLFEGGGTPEDALYRLFTGEVPREVRAGTTLHGVHRDDVEISLNGQRARLYASQGQTRSLALAMKLAEGTLSREIGGEEPVYLLDDVFSELDGERRSYLLSALGDRQVIITSCEPEQALSRRQDVALFSVRGGRVRPG